MELMTLDRDFTPTGKTKLKTFDVMWDRKYYESGQFSVQIRSSDYDYNMKYIYTKERPEVGLIQCVEYSDDGHMITLSGYFYEKKLSDKIVYPMFTQYGTRSRYVADMVNNYKADIPKLVVATYAKNGDVVQKQETGATLEECAHSTLQVEEKAYRCKYDYENDRMIFEIYQGLDRTQDQTRNNFVTFSQGFRNIKNVTSKADSSNFKNFFIVGGSGEGADRIYEIVDLSGDDYQQQVFIDCKNEKYDSEKQTLAEYKAALHQKGIEKAASYADVHNVEFDVSSNSGAQYLEDYDIGDKCDIIIEDIQKSYQARIIEILESWSKGEHKVTLTFGDKIPTLYERARIK